jgi:hypothetical protein
VRQRKNNFEKTLWINLKTCTTPVSVWYSFQKEFEGITNRKQVFTVLKDLQKIIVFDDCDFFFQFDDANTREFFKMVKQFVDKTHFLKMIMVTRDNKKD